MRPLSGSDRDGTPLFIRVSLNPADLAPRRGIKRYFIRSSPFAVMMENLLNSLTEGGNTAMRET
jgi:hypothetical protein